MVHCHYLPLTNTDMPQAPGATIRKAIKYHIDTFRVLLSSKYLSAVMHLLYVRWLHWSNLKSEISCLVSSHICQEYTPHEKRQYCLWQFVSQYTIKCYEQIPYFVARVDKVGYRCELLYEAHDFTFGILEIYHCWRFQGSGVIAALQIIGFIFFCTGMHHEYFF